MVDAFNSDLPYDRFVKLQLAADLLDADSRHLPALGLLTVGINMVRPTELPDNIDDRIDVVTRGFLGLLRLLRAVPRPQVRPDSHCGLLLALQCLPELAECPGTRPDENLDESPESRFFQDKLAIRRATIDDFRNERLADHVGEFRRPETLAKYLEAAWEARDLSNQELETLSKQRNLNHYLLARWRTYLNLLPDPSIEAFRDLASPDGAMRVATRMAEADSAYRWPDPERETLRLALRGTGSPTDIPAEDFWWIQNEGDSNVMKGLRWQFEAVMHEWSYRGGPKHAMVVRDAPEPQPAYVFLRGNQHDKGREVGPGFLSALPGAREFRSGSGRLELARSIASPGKSPDGAGLREPGLGPPLRGGPDADSERPRNPGRSPLSPGAAGLPCSRLHATGLVGQEADSTDRPVPRLPPRQRGVRRRPRRRSREPAPLAPESQKA